MATLKLSERLTHCVAKMCTLAPGLETPFFKRSEATVQAV